MAPNQRVLESPAAVRRRRNRLALLLPILAACGADGGGEPEPADRASVDRPASVPTLGVRSVGTTALLQAVSPASANVVWLSGHEGTWVRSVDGGESWVVGVVPGHETLQFRDVHGFDARNAVLMSAGTGPESRIFRTADGGDSWNEVFRMDEAEGFLDCMDFWDRERGIVYGDALDGELYLLVTEDGGGSWRRVAPGALPPAQEGEGGFAASGTCVATEDPDRAWIATGNGPEPRLLRTDDGGETWSARDLPLVGGTARGATTVGMRPDGMGFALGGDLDPEGAGIRVALTADRGATWSVAGELQMAGAVYGAAWVPDREPATLFAVGPGGIDWSADGGMTWSSADSTGHWAVGFASRDLGWAVGPEGRVTEIRLRP